MVSRQFMVDPAKKKKNINILLQVPNLCVPEAMKLAKFTKDDVADLGLRHFLQCALPGGTVNAMKAHVAQLLPLQPRRNQHPTLDDTIANVNAAIVNVEANIVYIECAAPVAINAVINVKRTLSARGVPPPVIPQPTRFISNVKCKQQNLLSTKIKRRKFSSNCH